MKKKKNVEQFDLFAETKAPPEGIMLKNCMMCGHLEHEKPCLETKCFCKHEGHWTKVAADGGGIKIKFHEPSREEVNAMIKETGKSYRKCYFMVAERLNRKPR